MENYNDEKRMLAIEYLRSRGKYILDGGSFKPTAPTATDVAKTFAQYRAQTEGKLKLVKGRK